MTANAANGTVTDADEGIVCSHSRARFRVSLEVWGCSQVWRDEKRRGMTKRIGTARNV